MSKRPTVSVITPVYNAARFLPRVIECVRRQRDIDLEHILVDDASTDESLQILQRLAVGDARTRIISNPSNCGPVVARNRGISEARGEYLAFLDSDDIWAPDKLCLQSRFMAETGATISFSDYRHVSEDGRKIGRLIRGPNRVGWRVHHVTRYLGCLTIMVNRDKFPDFCFPTINPAVRAEDFLAWSNVLKSNGPALRCPHDLARYSVVAGSRSSNFLQAGTSVWYLYRKLEAIPFVESVIYYTGYALFAVMKKSLCRPIWPREIVDSDFEYQLL